MGSRPDSRPLPPSQRTADRLHSAAIHLLRRLRAEDDATGLSAPRLSALSVLVFAGPLPLGELAAAEQVSAPTMSRLVKGLEGEGLVTRSPDPEDGRVRRVEATVEGRRVLMEGKRRRVERLAGELDALPPEKRRILDTAAGILERLSLPEGHPRTGSDPSSDSS